MILVDTSGLLGALNEREPQHRACRNVLDGHRDLVLSPFVLAEADYLVTTRVGVDAELALLEDVAAGAYELAPFDREELGQARTLLERYRDLDIGLTDASILVLADKLGIDAVLSLDERHFRTARTPSGRSLTIFPVDA